jgi:hypothetical protein
MWETGLLVCDEFGRGWAAFVADDLDETNETDGSDPPNIVLVYCPVCAAAEFAHRPEQAEEYT